MKTGYQTTKKYRTKHFDKIESYIGNGRISCGIKQSHILEIDFNREEKFVFDTREEEEKLYQGKPCVYTDKRYSQHIVCAWCNYLTIYQSNYYDYYLKRKKEYLSRKPSFPKNTKGQLTIKSAIRKINKIKGLPKNLQIKISSDWSAKKNTDFIYVVKKYKENNIKYKIDLPEFLDNFTDDINAKNLVTFLRSNGFIVKVSETSDVIDYDTNTNTFTYGEKHQICRGYGHGITFMFSSFNNTYNGYSVGTEYILFDWFGCFNKPSDAEKIFKNTSHEDILKIFLMNRDDYLETIKIREH